MIHVNPELGLPSFSCPKCNALAHQTWFHIFPKKTSDSETPFVPADDVIDKLENGDIEQQTKDMLIAYFGKSLTRMPFVDREDTVSLNHRLANTYAAQCFSCSNFSVWVFDKLVFPSSKFLVVPATEMPEPIKLDFDEASEIVEMSPRGAAALLRLCVQKLCVHLGGAGKDLNTDIGMLVEKGLSVHVQQALDIVRVIGNNAVHPGVIDLRDDRETATKLFSLVNLIIESQITQPNTIQKMFGNLPDSYRTQIERRDKPKD